MLHVEMIFLANYWKILQLQKMQNEMLKVFKFTFYLWENNGMQV
jgi:hypothetical protein